jgi:hypothetical protein
MDRVEDRGASEFLRQEEMKELIAAEKDRITAQLMSRAANMVVLRILRKESGPIADFDLVYFMEVIKEFADDHEALRMILNGKGDELNWMAEEE